MLREGLMGSMSLRSRWIALVAILVAACAVTTALKPIPQPLWYHDFADSRTMLGIPRALDVLSNLPFVLVGLAGLYFTLRNRALAPLRRWACLTLFAGLFLTGIGSAYYHLAPDNQRLLWDRLPMTIAMAGLISLLLVNRIASLPFWPLPLLVAGGMATVLQWAWSEAHGHGDLRLYALYQALVFISGAGLLLIFPTQGERSSGLVFALLANVAAKIFELLDKQIFAIGHVVSGHTLKHLAAGLGFVPLVAWLASQPQKAETMLGNKSSPSTLGHF
jgi:hypothetical protein